jgi:hypothetical protein
VTIHTLTNGLVVTTFPPPPAGFDLKKATDSERARFGIPRFAPGSFRDKRLSEILSEMDGRIRLVEPAFLPRDRRRNKLPHIKPDHSPDHGMNTPTWSGGITQGVDPRNYNERIWSVSGTWNIPEVWSPAGAEVGVTYTASTWIGIDGFYNQSNSSLLQAGCDSDVTYVSPGYEWDYYQFNPWVEWWPTGSAWITGVPATSQLDEYKCSIQCTSLLNHSAANSASVYLANVTRGWGMYFNMTAPKGVTLHGNSAEWIVEAPPPLELPIYTNAIFTNCTACTISGQLIESGSGDTINMVNSSNQVISQAELVGSNQVEVYYSLPV